MTGVEALVGQAALEHPTDLLVVLSAVRDASGQVVDLRHEAASPAAVLAMGRSYVGTYVSQSDDGDTVEVVLPWLLATLRSGTAQMWRKTADLPGAPAMDGVLYEMWAHPVGDHLVLQLRDRAEEARLREVAERGSATDVLTGLPNRQSLVASLRRALHRLGDARGPLAVIFCELDGLDLVQDTRGHGAADDLLRRCAERVAACSRPEDVVARFGGDDLVVLCEDLEDATAASGVARAIQRGVSGTYDVGGAVVRITAWVGVTTAGDPVDGYRLLRQAATAAHEAKRRDDDDRVELYSQGLSVRAAEELRLRDELGTALDAGQLELHYQPTYDLVTGEVAAAEALLRWRHPTQGLKLPGQFLPAAQDAGLMPRIGRFVLAAACAEAHSWRALRASPPSVNVNLGPRELGGAAVEDALQHALTTSGLDPRRLTVEITETDAPDDVNRLADVLDRIRALGPTIAVDDFGTGYSSLLWLQRFPVSVVKLDRTFVSRLTTPGNDRAIIKATIDLAHALGMQVVAEGIETPVQRDVLVELGCDYGQGFALARPMPAAELRALIAAAARVGDGPGSG